MGEYHDQAASYCGDTILTKIRSGDRTFKQIFSQNIIRTGSWDWPRPDYVCFDEDLKGTYALEFKPPAQSKREYLTGLGQSLSYLQHHTYSGLIVPTEADDGFPIATFICTTLQSAEFQDVGTSLYAYNPTDYSIELMRPIKKLRTITPSGSTTTESVKTFWCWWRDMSHYELLSLLKLSFSFNDEQGDIYSKHIYPKFYDMMVNKKTKQWDGTPRNKKLSLASMRSEKQNYNIPLVQLGLWTRGEGRLTDIGFTLLGIGSKYGANSKQFLDALTYLILVEGRHLELIHLVKKFQDSTPPTAMSKDYALQLEAFLTQSGCIGKRKPTAVKTGAKISYMRDEMKLWNKLGLLEAENGSYYVQGVGYKFNWERITSVLSSNKFLLQGTSFWQ